jgi:uncharacterized membrane protein
MPHTEPISDDELRRRRSTSAYRAAIWVFRLSFMVSLVFVVLLAAGLFEYRPAVELLWLAFVFALSAVNVVQFRRAGVGIGQRFASSGRRRTFIWKDAFWPGRSSTVD